MELNPDELTGSQRYKLMIGGITPRPIAFVTSQSPHGLVNLAPFSFFNATGPSPMTLMFSPVTKSDGSQKDTLRNVALPDQGGIGEFVVNLAVEAYARQVSASAAELPFDDDELELVGLTAAPSVKIRPPRVAESPVAFECVTTQIIPMDPGRPASGNVVFGRVVHVFVRDDVIDERFWIDPEKVATIGRMGGHTYTRTRERFDLPNGLDTLKLPDPFT